MGDLGDPLAASLGKTSSSYVGKMFASHGNPVAPSVHKSALSLHTQDTFKTQTPARTHPQVPHLVDSAGEFNCAPDTCCPGITYSLPGRMTRQSPSSNWGTVHWDVQEAPSLVGSTQPPSILPRVTGG